jgi:protein subunit release factor A
MKTKTKLFSVTKEDFDWEFYVGSGDGGQKRQKTKSACRCTHRESGAVGVSQDSRLQLQNRKTAFERCTSTKLFKTWLQLRIDDETGKVKTEVTDGDRWTEVEKWELKD